MAARVDAADCRALLHSFFKDPADPSYYSTLLVTMSSLDSNNVASYAQTRLYYMTPARLPCAEPNFDPPQTLLGRLFGTRPKTECVGRYLTLPGGGELGGTESAKFDFGAGAQVFSDRFVAAINPRVIVPGLPGRGHQKFDEARPDDLNVEITDSDPVLVWLILRSQGGRRVRFQPTCQAGGFLVGSTGDTHYILRIQEF
jgi:hypothetical protein